MAKITEDSNIKLKMNHDKKINKAGIQTGDILVEID